MWERIASIGLGTWVLCACAMIAGVIIAHTILVPNGAIKGDGRARQLARYRALIGFGFVTVLSIPHRSPEETLDKAWGNFNISIGIALAVFLALSLIFWLSLRGDSREQLRIKWPTIWFRVGKFIVTLLVYFAAMYLSGVGMLQSPELARLLLIVLSSFFGFVAMGCWYISCHWFGMGQAHPLLPPLVAAATICIATVLELRFDGPDQLPLQLWLLISFSAVITTFGVCFVEICDAIEGSGPRYSGVEIEPTLWPVVTAATLVVLALTGTVMFVGMGTAERMLCADAAPLLKCVNASEVPPR